MKLNPNFERLKENYLFSEIAKKTEDYARAHPEARIIKMGIGDVTRPLVPAVIAAMSEAVAEMGEKETFKGYAPSDGYPFLKESVKSYYASLGAAIETDEIFISDGAKSDLGNLLDLFSTDNTALVPDPVYPVYVDTNALDGRRIILAKGAKENGFLPMPDRAVRADIIYICSPNNPTGAAYDRAGLAEWVSYANDTGAVIIYDAAYERFAEGDVPRSIFVIEEAKYCAIECCSFSKTAGFTGVRCGYCVIPFALERGGVRLNKAWRRLRAAKFNGVAYPIQRGAAAAYSAEGLAQIDENIRYYKRNASLLSRCLDEAGVWHTGGKHSPYIWLKCPCFFDSRKFFDCLLDSVRVVGTPGAGFGENGEGYFRLTAFSSFEDAQEGIYRLKEFLKGKV